MSYTFSLFSSKERVFVRIPYTEKGLRNFRFVVVVVIATIT